MTPSNKAKIALMSAALAAWQPAAAQKAPDPSHDVSVAIVDIGANSLYSKDANVRFVDMTPPLKAGDRHASARKIGKMDHGDIVAQAFVDEYRRIDPDARITFYTVNPFVQRSDMGSMMFSRSMLTQALPKIKEAGARVVVTTFGVADQVAGERILKDFQDNGMIVFAATPNQREDPGIWPAASPAAIAVADGVTPDSGFNKNRAWSGWVDFVANGNYHYGSVDTDGSSFATPRVAAYGAYIQKAHPDIEVEGMRASLKEGSRPTHIHDREFPLLGGDSSARRFIAMESRGTKAEEVAQTQAPDGGAAAPKPDRRVVMAALASTMAR